MTENIKDKMTNGGNYPYIPQDKESQLQMKVLMAFISAGVPIGFVSDPGRGKTATIQAVAETMGRELINLSLSTLPSEDVAGIPSIVKQKIGENGQEEIARTEYAMPGWQLRILNNPNSILFLDELTTAPPSTQHAFLQIIQDRRFPGSPVPFSDKVGIVVAMNPAGQAGGSSLDPPIANRFGWFPFKMPYEAWINGFTMGWKSDKPMPVPGVETDPERIAENDRRFRETVKMYLDNEGHKQTNLMPSADDDVSNVSEDSGDAETEAEIAQLAFMSNRSWDNLARVAKYLEPDDFMAINSVSKGLIGVKNSIKFNAFYKSSGRGFNIEKIMEDPTKTDWKSMTIDTSTSLFQSLLTEAQKGPKQWEKVMDVYFAIYDSGAKDLCSGNRVDDIWRSKYMKGSDKLDYYRDEYLNRFGSMMRKSVNRNRGRA